MKLRALLLPVVALALAGLVLTGCGSSDKDDPADVSGTTETSTPGAGPQTFDAYPAMEIDTKKKYSATLELAKGGTVEIQLYADKAPKAVNSFVFLARKHYFDGVTFHRVLDGFMAQGGDPDGTGTGGPGYTFDNEISDLTFDKAGVVAMANTGQPNSNGSQFFITFGPQDFLNGGYTIFGQVTTGMDVVNGITRRDPGAATTPGDMIKTVTITEK